MKAFLHRPVALLVFCLKLSHINHTDSDTVDPSPSDVSRLIFFSTKKQTFF